MNIFPGKEFSRDELSHPANEYDVTYMWLWNEAISRELIDAELAEYKKAGINSLYFVPLPKDFRPDTMRTFLSPEYMTEEFLDIAEYAVKRAIELGMKPWLYDEGGWPSGGACGITLRQNPNAKLKFLEKRSVLLKCGEPFKPSEGFVALFEEKERLPDDYTASSDITVTEYRLIEQVFNGNRVDYTDESVVDTFINNAYEKYKERLGDLFGSELPVIFTDEPGLTQNSIASDEFDLFIKRFGYDLRDYLYVIEDSGSLCKTEAEVKARIDHGVLLGELIKKYAFEKISKWCEKANIHLTGHLDADNRPWGGLAVATFSPLDALRSFQIPGIDVIWEQIRYPYGGRAVLDDETLGFGFFPRMASSAARQCGRNVALTESLSIFGDGLTHNEMRYVINYQMIRGINAINFAALPIGKTRASYIWARPSFRPEKPGFFNLRELNEYYARLSYLARLGYAEGDTALYIPCRDFWAEPKTLNNSNAAFKALGTSLETDCIPFDMIDDAGIISSKDTGDGLLLGNALYRHIAVPKNMHMPDEVKKKIAPYLGCGAPNYKAKSDKLRFMTRKLSSSRLWFVFNEGEQDVCEPLNIAYGKKVYRIDARDGRMYREDLPVCSLSCGDIAVYLVTDEDYECSPETVESTYEVNGFRPTAHKRFIIEYEGATNEYGDGNITIDESFSGEVTYCAEYELDDTPKADETYQIRLEGFSSTVLVKLGEIEIPLGMTPMTAKLAGARLRKNGEINVTVSNTAINELYTKMDVVNTLPKAELGPYLDKLAELEARRPTLKFGKVFIEKLEL